jgi:hypothetical protein
MHHRAHCARKREGFAELAAYAWNQLEASYSKFVLQLDFGRGQPENSCLRLCKTFNFKEVHVHTDRNLNTFSLCSTGISMAKCWRLSVMEWFAPVRWGKCCGKQHINWD